MQFLSFSGDKRSPQPELIVRSDTDRKLQTYFVAPFDLTLCFGEYNLAPYETRAITVFLSPAAPVVRSDEVIISAPTLGHRSNT